MTKYIRDTKLGQSLDVYLVRDNARVNDDAKVYVQHCNGGTVKVEIHSVIAGKYDTQVGSATGFGYDKVVAALAGLKIHGIELFIPCIVNDELTDKLAAQWDDIQAVMAIAPGNPRYSECPVAVLLKNTGCLVYGILAQEKPPTVYYRAGLERLAYMNCEVIKVF